MKYLCTEHNIFSIIKLAYFFNILFVKLEDNLHHIYDFQLTICGIYICSLNFKKGLSEEHIYLFLKCNLKLN